MATSAIQIIRSLQVDYGLGDDTILVCFADFVDKWCDMETFENFMLDRAGELEEPDDI